IGSVRHAGTRILDRNAALPRPALGGRVALGATIAERTQQLRLTVVGAAAEARQRTASRLRRRVARRASQQNQEGETKKWPAGHRQAGHANLGKYGQEAGSAGGRDCRAANEG